jgi:Mn-dependent DtxR family transcriptional regulator
MELSRLPFHTEPYKSLSNNAKLLFVILNELEQRYSIEGTDYFYHSNEQLAEELNVTLKTFKKAKAELLKTDLVKTWQMPFQNKETGKKSAKHVTVWKILK